MQGFTYIDLIILVVYLAAVLFAGLHFAKKEMKGKEYFKGDGTVPWWVTSILKVTEPCRGGLLPYLFSQLY